MNLAKYRKWTKGKPFSYCVKIALLLLDSNEAYGELEEEASKSMIREGQPSAIFERVVSELLDLKFWYLPDDVKIWDRRFGSLFESKFFCYDDEPKTWSKILDKYFVQLEYMPKKEDYSSTKSFNNAWGWFAELLVVVKENNHPEFANYYEIAIKNGMPIEVFDKKAQELLAIKQTFVDQ